VGAAWAQSTPAGSLRQGLDALNAGRLKEARAKLERATREQPEQAWAWLSLAKTYRLLGEESSVEAPLQHAEALAAGNPAVRSILAMYWADAGDPAIAAEQEKLYAASAPGDPNVEARIASYSLEAGRTDDAVMYGLLAIEKRDDADRRSLLGKAYAAEGRLEDAERELRAAIRHEPYDEERRYDLGYLFLQAQQFDRALEAFAEGLEVFDKSARITTGIGIAHYGLRSFDQAVGSFLDASKLAPGVEQPCYFLGRMLTQATTRIDEVVERFEAFEAARPESYLGPYLTAIGRLAAAGASADEATLQEAAAKLNESIERRDAFWEAHYELGVLLERLDRHREAAERLQRAAELNPESSKPHYRLARVYRRLGNDELARAERDTHARLVEEERSSMKSGAMGGSPLVPVVK